MALISVLYFSPKKLTHHIVNDRLITLEDVFEALLQEQIYDEKDQMEKEAGKIGRWASRKWRKLKKKRELEAAHKASSMASVVVEAMDNTVRHDLMGETTFLLRKDGDEGSNSEHDGGILGFFQSLGRNNSTKSNN
jgi:hypothetical protein